MGALLVPCPGCSRHVRASESVCPFCAASCAGASPTPPARVGAPLTRAALLFATATAITACGGKQEDASSSSGTASSSGSSGGSSSGSSGASSSSSSSGAIPPYGLPPIEEDAGDPDAGDAGKDGSSSGAMPAYGVPPIDGG